MKPTKWISFAPLSTYQKSLDEFFNSRYRRLLDMDDRFSPAINASEKRESYSIEITAKGLKKEDLHVAVVDGVLTISGDSDDFTHFFVLPPDVDDEHINARFEDGVLYVDLPRELPAGANEAVREVPIR